MRLLITHSLLSSWSYLFTDFDRFGDGEEYRSKAAADFAATLSKAERPTTETQQRGKDFEQLVMLIAQGQSYDEIMLLDPQEQTEIPPDDPAKPIPPLRRGKTNWEKWYDAAARIAAEVKDGQFQVAVSRKITLDGLDFLLYGRLDCLKAGRIMDIKFSKNYTVGKFFYSTQHPMYLELAPEARDFTYLVSNGAQVWQETYFRQGYTPISNTIQEFIGYLRRHDLFSVYEQHWQAKYD